MNPGVSLQIITSFPSFISENLVIDSTVFLSTSSSGTISKSRIYLGGLKKCVIIKFFENFLGIPSTSFALGIVDVFELTIDPFLRCSSILL